MKVFKNNFKLIIGFIVGVILASGITVYAYSCVASDVKYTKPGTTTEISVEQALNDLYSSSNNKGQLKYMETCTSISSEPYNFVFSPNGHNKVYIITLGGGVKNFGKEEIASWLNLNEYGYTNVTNISKISDNASGDGYVAIWEVIVTNPNENVSINTYYGGAGIQIFYVD